MWYKGSTYLFSQTPDILLNGRQPILQIFYISVIYVMVMLILSFSKAKDVFRRYSGGLQFSYSQFSVDARHTDRFVKDGHSF
jgi:hypothetical protein